MPRPGKSIEELTEMINTYNNSEFKLIKFITHESKKSRILVKHLTCGREFEVIFSNLITLNRGCKYCNSNRVDSKKISDMINLKDPNHYICISCGEKTSEFANIKHIDCGKVFKMRAADFLYNNHRCSYCNKKPVYTDESIKNKVTELAPGYKLVSLDPLTENQKPCKRKITIFHEECGTETKLILHNFVTNNQRCKYCSLKKLRISEKSHQVALIEKFLTENNISFVNEKTFPDLKYKKPLRFDFYNDCFKEPIIIEFDGKQHFKSNQHNKIFTEEKLRTIQLRDEIKNQYCKNNNIELIRFNYLQDDAQILKILGTRFFQ